MSCLSWPCVCVCVFDYLTALPWFMCLGPVRAVPSLCEKNHSFPRVEDERVFRLQTPLGLCGLDCLSLFLYRCVIYFLKKKEAKNQIAKKKKKYHLWRRNDKEAVKSWTISLISKADLAAMAGCFSERVRPCTNTPSIKNSQWGRV